MAQDTAGPITAPNKPGGDRHTAAARKSTAERANEALRLRILGNSFETIAKKAGYANRSGAHKAVSRALKNITRENATELREQELQRLDIAQLAIMGQVIAGNFGAVDRLIKIVDQRAKLTGLYENVADSGVEEFKSVLREWRQSLDGDDLDDDDEESSDEQQRDAEPPVV